MTVYRLARAQRPRYVRIQLVAPHPSAIGFARRVRRVWAELTIAQQSGERMPSVRTLAERCDMPSTSTVQLCIRELVSMGIVDVLGRTEDPDRSGARIRYAGAIRVVKPFGWERYE